MKNKVLKFGKVAREKLLEGVQELAKAVSSTMGPRGKVVVNMLPDGTPVATKDGVSVAREISFKDPFKNAGAQLLKQAAQHTANTAGDGTTTATVLAEAMFKRAIDLIEEGVNPVLLKRGMDQAVKDIVKELKSKSKSCKTLKEIKQVATISCNGDTNIGTLIGKAMQKVGVDGTITVEESPTLEDTIELVDGVRFDKGAINNYFLLNMEKQQMKLDNPYVLITSKKLTHIRSILGLLDGIAKEGRPLLILAEALEGEALQSLVVNNVQGILKTMVVQPPEMGEMRISAMEDLALLTGATLITDAMGTALESVSKEDLGSAKSVIVTGTHTTIVGGGGDKDKIKGKIKELEKLKKETKKELESILISNRLARLTGAVAVIKLGAATELELREKLDRVDDARRATQAAVEEGIIPGGGVTLYKIAEPRRSVEPENEGYNLVCEAVQQPFRQILINAGLDPIKYEETLVFCQSKFNTGFNVDTGEECDMIEAGVVDPTKVVRVALQNAASVVGLMVTTSCVIAEEEEKKEEITYEL